MDKTLKYGCKKNSTKGTIMLENLFVYALLLDVGFIPISEYGDYLDTSFTKKPDDNLLLELEWSFSDIPKSIAIIYHYCNVCVVDYDAFGSFLCQKLSEIYFQYKNSINDFGSKAYAIWQRLPSVIHQTEPFWTLSYADDPLSWGDENQTRELYEQMFFFYNK